MALSWFTKFKIRLRHWRISQPERRKLRIDFDQIVESGWPEAPLTKQKKSSRFSSTTLSNRNRINIEQEEYYE